MTGTDAAQRPTDYRAPAGRPAAVGRRVGAYLIDSAIALLVLLIAVGIFAGISFATGGGFPLPVAALGGYVVLGAWLLVYTLMQGGNGSLGMRALGLRLAHVADDGPLGFGRALGRNLVWGLGSSIVVGVFSPLFDGSPWHRGWHDKASGAVMTDVAGHGPVVAAPVVPAAVTAAPGAPQAVQPGVALPGAAAPSATPSGAPLPPPPPAPTGAASVSGLPAAPILPGADAPELADVVPVPPARPAPQASGLISFVPGVSDPETFDAPPPAAAPGIPVVDAPSSSAAAAPPPADARGAAQPVLDDPLDQTRISTGERPVARLTWDDGTSQALYGRTVFGRNPAPETGAMVSPVRDETLSLSKTHFELAVIDGVLWVTDRHSTNGVVIRRGTQRQQAVAGEPARVRMGDVLEFGDRHVVVEVAP